MANITVISVGLVRHNHHVTVRPCSGMLLSEDRIERVSVTVISFEALHSHQHDPSLLKYMHPRTIPVLNAKVRVS
jgi:hypothetical protein